jgi:hypothetical protein
MPSNSSKCECVEINLDHLGKLARSTASVWAVHRYRYSYKGVELGYITATMALVTLRFARTMQIPTPASSPVVNPGFLGFDEFTLTGESGVGKNLYTFSHSRSIPGESASEPSASIEKGFFLDSTPNSPPLRSPALGERFQPTTRYTRTSPQLGKLITREG